MHTSAPCTPTHAHTSTPPSIHTHIRERRRMHCSHARPATASQLRPAARRTRHSPRRTPCGQSERAFLDAAWEGKLAEVQEHLRNGVNVHAKNPVCMSVCLCARVRARLCARVRARVCLSVCLCVCVHVCVCVSSVSVCLSCLSHLLLARASISGALLCPSITRCIHASMDMCIDASIAADVYMLYVSSNGSRYMHARTVRARTHKRRARSQARTHTRCFPL